MCIFFENTIRLFFCKPEWFDLLLDWTPKLIKSNQCSLVVSSHNLTTFDLETTLVVFTSKFLLCAKQIFNIKL